MDNTIELAKEFIRKGDVGRAFLCYAKASGRNPDVFREIAKCYEEGIGVEANKTMARKYARLERRAKKRWIEMRRRDARLMHKMKCEGRASLTRRLSKERIVFSSTEARVLQIRGFIAARRVRRNRKKLNDYGNYVARAVMTVFTGSRAIQRDNWISALACAL